jgi:hypothetical protein
MSYTKEYKNPSGEFRIRVRGRCGQDGKLISYTIKPRPTSTKKDRNAALKEARRRSAEIQGLMDEAEKDPSLQPWRSPEELAVEAAQRHHNADLLVIIDDWLQTLSYLKPSTRETYQRRLSPMRAFLETNDFSRKPEVLSEAFLTQYTTWLRATGRHGHGRAESTVSKHLKVFLQCWKWAAAARGYSWSGLVPTAPHRPRLPQVSSIRRSRRDTPSWKEMDAYIRAASSTSTM